MLLQTSILARRDGTVRATRPGGDTVVFTLDEDGALVADVTDSETIAWLLGNPLFFRADKAADVAIDRPAVGTDVGQDESIAKPAKPKRTKKAGK